MKGKDDDTLNEIQRQIMELQEARQAYLLELSCNHSPERALHLNNLIGRIDTSLDVADKIMSEIDDGNGL